MDQLRHLLYHTPASPLPWDPTRARPESDPAPPVPPSTDQPSATSGSPGPGAAQVITPILHPTPRTPESARSSPRSDRSGGGMSPAQKYLVSEINHSPERGHPNIAKLLDFFEDREFYYRALPSICQLSTCCPSAEVLQCHGLAWPGLALLNLV
jgi:protein-serine/threonine kinase